MFEVIMPFYTLLFSLMIFLFQFATTAFADNLNSEEQKKIAEFTEGKRVNCDSFEPKMTPSLNFETFSPKVLVNADSSYISLQLKIIYYRCQKKLSTDTPTFTLVSDPNTPYDYVVEQFDGSTNNVFVKGHKHRLKALLAGKGDNETSILSKEEHEGNIYNFRLNLPIDKLLSSGQKIQLRNGTNIKVTIPIISELSTDYKVNTQTQGSTDFEPGTQFRWEIEFSQSKQNKIQAELIKIY